MSARHITSVCGVLLLSSLVGACQTREPRAIYLIPDRYVGWLCVHYGQPDAMPLEAEGRFKVLRFGPDGVVRTSDDGRPGTGFEDRFFYVSSSTTRRSVPTGDMGGGGTYARPTDRPGRYVFFLWVGADRTRYRPAVDAGHVENGPRCGPV